MLPLRHARRWHTASVILLLVVLVATLMPVVWFWPDRFKALTWFESVDKWLHGVVFLVLSVWFSGQFRARSYWRIAVGLLVFGLVIEGCQRMVSYRTADWIDVAIFRLQAHPGRDFLDRRNVWSYDLDLQQVTVKPQQQALANTPALLLGGSEDALQQFNFGGTTVEEVTTWVRLEPKNSDNGFNRIELGFIDEKLQRMIFFDNLEQTTLVALYDVIINEPIDAERFEFLVPAGVDVVGVPIAAEVSDL